MVGSTIRFLIAYSIAGRWEGLGTRLELKYFPDGQSVMNNVAIELEILQATLILYIAILCACILGHTHTHTHTHEPHFQLTPRSSQPWSKLGFLHGCKVKMGLHYSITQTYIWSESASTWVCKQTNHTSITVIVIIFTEMCGWMHYQVRSRIVVECKGGYGYQ